MFFQFPLRSWYVRGDSVKAHSVSKSAAWISNKLLRAGIILLGFKLNLSTLFASGVKTILLAVVVVAGTIAVAYWIARRLKVSKHLAILTAGGTGICGAAAVMGLSGSMRLGEGHEEEQEEDEVIAVASVAIMGTVFALFEIALQPILGLTASQFGVVAGASLHEIAHAVAVGGAGGAVAMDAAIIMKLSRVLMLAPAAIILGAWWARSTRRDAQTAALARGADASVPPAARGHVPLPWFMLGFIAASVLGTYVPFIAEWTGILVKIAYLVLGIAMAALGINVNFSAIAQRGKSAFLASFITSILLLAFAFGAAVLFF